MPTRKVDKNSWSIPKRVKIDEEIRKSSPFDERVRVTHKKRDPSVCHVTKKPHYYKEIDRWQWSTLFKNWSGDSADTIHITLQCNDCGKKTHTHEKI
jgi:hypothetical protein